MWSGDSRASAGVAIIPVTQRIHLRRDSAFLIPGRLIAITATFDSSPVRLVNVYAPSESHASRTEWWTLLSQHAKAINPEALPIILGDDLNEEHPCPALATNLSIHGLLPRSSGYFSHVQKTRAGICRRKIDQFFATPTLHTSLAAPLDAPFDSDHAPIVIEVQAIVKLSGE